MRQNQLKQKIKQGETVLGLFMNCAYPGFIEICGHAGFDFAVIDMEYGPLHPLAAEDLYRAPTAAELHQLFASAKTTGRKFNELSKSAVKAFKYLKLKAKLMPKPLSKALNTVLWVREAFPSLRGPNFTPLQVQISSTNLTKNP